MGGDFVSTFRGVLDGSPMQHGEVPNIFPQTWKREHAGLAGWHADGSRGFAGWVASGSEARGSRIGAGGLLAGLAGWHADRSWAARSLACGLEIGVVGRHATRIGAGGLHNGGACIGAGPDGWNRRTPTQKVIACVSRGKSSPQRLFLKSMRH